MAGSENLPFVTNERDVEINGLQNMAMSSARP
jgi:hypothetical protein